MRVHRSTCRSISPILRRGSQPSATLFNYDAKIRQRKDLESEMASEGIWNNQDRAKKVVVSVKALKAQLDLRYCTIAAETTPGTRPKSVSFSSFPRERLFRQANLRSLT